MKITSIQSLEILDSRGKPTVRTFVKLEDGSIHSSSVPSGASTGAHEAVELRDGDSKRHLGQGVLQAVANVNTVLAPLVVGMEVDQLKEIDQKMLDKDGTGNKGNLGANAILSVSQAVTKAAAYTANKPLWRFLHDYYFSAHSAAFPRLMVNVINGGKHANWNFDIQEFMISPSTTQPSEAVRVAAEIFQQLGKTLKEKKLQTLVGDEGGYSPLLSSNEEVLETIKASAEKLGYSLGREFDFALDSASTEFFENGSYVMKKTGKTLSGDELMNYYQTLRSTYRIISFEDPFAEDDWAQFQKFTAFSNDEFLTVGDDLYVTNPERIRRGIELNATNAVLIKLNQIGSVSETAEAITMAKQAGWKVIVSHRSGETEDSFIADLAYGAGADFIKTGSMSRSERLAKYNRLIEIENGL
ncbi:phosphopyruvate hydratase [Candidatus Roizmanbacteria bacterium]|nr:phosphopyruvate hydratase [Candidatus Roizmanbacteria bacterium]